VETWGDRIEALLARTNEQRSRGRIHIAHTELVWEEEKMARSALVVSHLTGFSLRTMHCFIAEIPPGGRTGRHRHNNEAILLCLSGSGYSIVDGGRYDWEAGDALAMPVMAWHQHVNRSATEPCRYYGITNMPLMDALALAEVQTAERGSHIEVGPVSPPLERPVATAGSQDIQLDGRER
jgi:gentisate 1,2-dioxygenase